MIEKNLQVSTNQPDDVLPWGSLDRDNRVVDWLPPTRETSPDDGKVGLRPGWRRVSALHRGNHVPLVGRTTELASLQDAFTRTRAGSSACMMVSGDAGVGKSCLLQHFMETVGERFGEVLVLSGRCHERRSVPYNAFEGIVRHLSQALRSVDDALVASLFPRGAGLLTRAFPVLGLVEHSYGLPVEGTDANPPELRHRAFEALRDGLRRLASTRPLLLSIDDLQWADEDSFALLDAVMSAPREPHLMLLASHRGPTSASLQRVLDRLGKVGHVRLEPLSTLSATELARGLLANGGQPAGSAVIQEIVENAKGEPLFIEELVRLRAAGLRGEHLPLPELIHQRVERLPSASQRTLHALAVAGASISLELVARVCNLDAPDALHAARALLDAALVRGTGAARGSTMETAHDRVREAVLSGLDAGERRMWHARIASTLERFESMDVAFVASHWWESGHKDRAAKYYVSAAEQSTRTMAFARAAEMYERAISSDAFDHARMLTLRHLHASVLESAGMLGAAAEARLALARVSGGESRVTHEHRAAELLMCSGRHGHGSSVLRSSLRSARIYRPELRPMLVLGILFWWLYVRLRGLDPRTTGPDEPREERLDRVDILLSAGQGYAMIDSVKGVYFYARALAAALSAGEDARLARALGMAICARSAGGVAADACVARLQDALSRCAERVPTPESRGYEAGARGCAEYNAGRYRAAKEHLVRADALFRDRCRGVAYQLSTVRGMLFRTLFALGELPELRVRLGPVLEQATRLDDHAMISVCETVGSALLATQADDVLRAERALAVGFQHLSHGAVHLTYFWAHAAAAQVNLYRGQPTDAHGRMIWLEGELRRAWMWRVAPCRLVVTALRGQAAVACARVVPERAASLLRDAERCADELAWHGEPWALPTAQALRATVAAAHDRSVRARELMRQAAAGFRAQHMGLYAAAAQRLEGLWVGGAVGASLLREADAAFARAAVVRPERMTGLLIGEP